jgi:peptidyl-prolyl cis-trans isomerase D
MALDFLRRHQRVLVLRILLGVVVLSFIILYIPAFLTPGAEGAAQDVGSVNGVPITGAEFRRAYLRLRSQYERLYRVDAARLDAMGLHDQVFDTLVDERVIELDAKSRGLRVSDRALAQEVAGNASLQENGRFIGAERLRRLLEAQGLSLDEFERSLRLDLLRRQLESLLADGVSVSPAEVEREYKRRNEQIKAEYVLVDAAPLKASLSASDDEVKAHFEPHKEDYRIPETRAVDYVLTSSETLKTQVSVTEGEIETYYKSHQHEYREPEQVCARHVMIRVKGASGPQGHADEEAKKMAEQVLTQLKGGADFAATAKKFSEDPGMATKDGDLGCRPRGESLGDEFDNVAFNLKPGTLSDVVKTQYGYHVILAYDYKAEKQKTVGEVREIVKTKMLDDKARALAEAKSTAMAKALAQGKSLAEAAEASGLKVEKFANLQQGEASPPFDGAAISRVFQLQAGETEKTPLKVPGGQVFVALGAINAPRLPELAQVVDRVKSDVITAKAMAIAKNRADEVRGKAASAGLEKAADGVGLTRKETPQLVSRGQPIGDLPAGVGLDEAAFALPVKTLSEPIRVTNGYAIVRVLEKKSVDPAAFEKDRASFESSLRENRRSQLFQAYLTQARQRYAIEKRPEAFRNLIG